MNFLKLTAEEKEMRRIHNKLHLRWLVGACAVNVAVIAGTLAASALQDWLKVRKAHKNTDSSAAGAKPFSPPEHCVDCGCTEECSDWLEEQMITADELSTQHANCEHTKLLGTEPEDAVEAMDMERERRDCEGARQSVEEQMIKRALRTGYWTSPEDLPF